MKKKAGNLGSIITIVQTIKLKKKLDHLTKKELFGYLTKKLYFMLTVAKVRMRKADFMMNSISFVYRNCLPSAVGSWLANYLNLARVE